MSQVIESTPNVVANSALTIALCFAIAVIEGFDIQAIGVAAPKMALELGLNPKQMGFIFSSSSVGLVIGAALGGLLADRFGRKPIFIASVITFGACTLLTPFAIGSTSLYVIRFITGVGFGAAMPNMMAVAADLSPPDRRSSTAASMFCGMPLGGGLAALLTQLLPPDFDWRTLFFVGGVLPLALVPAIYAFMPETLQKGTSAKPARTGVVYALFGERRTTLTVLLWLTFVPTVLILYLLLNWLPTLALQKGLDRSTAPQVALAFNFTSVIGALMLGRIVDRFGARGSLTLSYLALIAVLFALSVTDNRVSMLVFSGLAGFFLLGVNYALYGIAAAYYPAHVRGTGSGVSVAMSRIGSIVGPLLAGWWLAGGASAGTVVLYLTPIAAVACISVFALSFVRHSNDH